MIATAITLHSLPFLQLQGVKSNGCGNQLPLLKARQGFSFAHHMTGQSKTQTLIRVPLCSSVKGKGHPLNHGEDEIRLKEGRSNPLMPAYCFQACHLACHQTRLVKEQSINHIMGTEELTWAVSSLV